MLTDMRRCKLEGTVNLTWLYNNFPDLMILVPLCLAALYATARVAGKGWVRGALGEEERFYRVNSRSSIYERARSTKKF